MASVRTFRTQQLRFSLPKLYWKSMAPNSVLLWESLVAAKQNGCRWFDIGGLSEETPKGIAEFKKGLNATPYGLVGEWLFPPKISLKQ